MCPIIRYYVTYEVEKRLYVNKSIIVRLRVLIPAHMKSSILCYGKLSSVMITDISEQSFVSMSWSESKEASVSFLIFM